MKLAMKRTPGELAKHTVDGSTSLRAGLKELEDIGYIHKKQTRDEGGKITGFKWSVVQKERR